MGLGLVHRRHVTCETRQTLLLHAAARGSPMATRDRPQGFWPRGRLGACETADSGPGLGGAPEGGRMGDTASPATGCGREQGRDTCGLGGVAEAVHAGSGGLALERDGVPGFDVGFVKPRVTGSQAGPHPGVNT